MEYSLNGGHQSDFLKTEYKKIQTLVSIPYFYNKLTVGFN